MLDLPGIVFLDVGIKAPQPARHSGSVLKISGGDGIKSETLSQGEDWPDGIDLDVDVGRLFWTCMCFPGSNQGVVKSSALDGSDVVTIIPQGVVNTPKQIRCETESKKLYFADREGMRILRCNYDGGALEVLVQLGDWQVEGTQDATRWCVGMAISRKRGKIYWTQKGYETSPSGRICSAGIEIPPNEAPSARSDIDVLFDNLSSPIDLDLDDRLDTIHFYWTERSHAGNSLHHAITGGSTGGAQPEVLVAGLTEAIGVKLDLVAGHIYVTDLGGSLYRCNLDGTELKTLYFSDSAALTGVTFLR